MIPDPCPQCKRGGTCNTPTCGRKRSSELMKLYGVGMTKAVESLAKDAERYRWLRSGKPRTTGAPKPGRIEVFRWDEKNEGSLLKDAALDAAIDAAMEQSK